jgi:5-formyltetrahydrofolate cyclo-ligase
MNGTDDIIRAKQQLRAKLRFRRRHFSENLDRLSALTAFRSLPDPLVHLLTENQPIVSGYAPSGGEPNILPLLAEHVDHQHIAMPHHSQRNEHMDFRLWGPDQPLVAGPWRTAQPASDNALAVPDILLVPMLGFDRRGGRLGQGGGHYDRYFAKHPDALRIGIAWSVQEIDETPSEPTDLPLDGILTEQEYIITGERLA